MPDWTSIIANVGFPIALCIYLIVKFEHTLRDTTGAVRELTLYIKSINTSRRRK